MAAKNQSVTSTERLLDDAWRASDGASRVLGDLDEGLSLLDEQVGSYVTACHAGENPPRTPLARRHPSRAEQIVENLFRHFMLRPHLSSMELQDPTIEPAFDALRGVRDFLRELHQPMRAVQFDPLCDLLSDGGEHTLGRIVGPSEHFVFFGFASHVGYRITSLISAVEAGAQRIMESRYGQGLVQAYADLLSYFEPRVDFSALRGRLRNERHQARCRLGLEDPNLAFFPGPASFSPTTTSAEAARVPTVIQAEHVSASSRGEAPSSKRGADDAASLTTRIEFQAKRATIRRGNDEVVIKGTRRVWLFRAVAARQSQTVSWGELVKEDVANAGDELESRQEHTSDRMVVSVPVMAVRPDSMQSAGSRIRRCLGPFAHRWHQDGYGVRFDMLDTELVDELSD